MLTEGGWSIQQRLFLDLSFTVLYSQLRVASAAKKRENTLVRRSRLANSIQNHQLSSENYLAGFAYSLSVGHLLARAIIFNSSELNT
jgi:hypothetical protein